MEENKNIHEVPMAPEDPEGEGIIAIDTPEDVAKED